LLEGYFAARWFAPSSCAAERVPHRRRIDRHPQPRRTARPDL
jgi:hypothetical protein